MNKNILVAGSGKSPCKKEKQSIDEKSVDMVVHNGAKKIAEKKTCSLTIVHRCSTSFSGMADAAARVADTQTYAYVVSAKTCTPTATLVGWSMSPVDSTVLATICPNPGWPIRVGWECNHGHYKVAHYPLEKPIPSLANTKWSLISLQNRSGFGLWPNDERGPCHPWKSFYLVPCNVSFKGSL